MPTRIAVLGAAAQSLDLQGVLQALLSKDVELVDAEVDTTPPVFNLVPREVMPDLALVLSPHEKCWYHRFAGRHGRGARY